MTVLAEDRRRAAGSVCSYCGEARLSGSQAREHPIPAVLQSKITVYTVCDDCNSRAGREVDQPWLDHFFVQAERADVGVGDPRHPGLPPTNPILNGVFKDEDGHIVVVRDGVPRYPGSVVETDEEVSIAADSQERANELRERVARRLPGRDLADHGSTAQSVRPHLSRRVKISMASGVRMGAKLGLAFGAEAFPEEWRLSPDATQLRQWLWSDRPVGVNGEPIAWVGSKIEDYPLARPPEHLVHFSALSEAVAVAALIFGAIPLVVPVAAVGTPLPRLAWRSGPGHRGHVVTTLDALMIDAVRRFNQDRSRSD